MMTADQLMQRPIAEWPESALTIARQLISTPTGLAALRAQRRKKAWVVQWVVQRAHQRPGTAGGQT